MTLFNFPKPIQLTLLILLILVATFFRFWQIGDYVVFLGDEGRDMIVMREIFTQGHLPFLGPTASVGGFYLGPIYYWMAAPFLWAWRFDPVGPSYMIAIFGVLTVLLLYKFLKETAGFWPAILASSLYAIAPLVVRYSRSSWNPNPLPFFSLLMIYLIYLGVTRKKILYFLAAGASFGIAIQLHYLATILIAIFGLIVITSSNFKRWPVIFLIYLLGSIITFSPFLIFEIRHGFPNFKTILEFVTRGSTVGYQTKSYSWLISNGGNIFLEWITGLKGTIITRLAFWILTFSGLFGLVKHWKNYEKRLIFSIAVIWFLGGLAGLRFYKGQVHDYYFGFLFPAPFLLAGLVFSTFWYNLFYRLSVVIVTILALIYFSVNGFYKTPPNRLINQTETVADFIIQKSNEEQFNFALISEHNSDHAYRYFLEFKGYRPVDLETMITNQLLVVCESQQCAPLGNPIWEIAGFGRGEIAGEWELPNIGIKVFKLTHWSGAPNPAGKPAIKGS
ncbi:MAG: hypothetical protein UU05_C0002G0008 [Candidatus Curtissbacteria bacterium GW2011_GWA1_40_47]|uniref:Glycosyltransferase RgtA/B/C/D-like domain-containing protein n=1 Tax=Candidatus Curtissbacteria bacterium RIFOXYA1_FULL_41_14 TaxID=1797737 RepID=A0A1F5HB29_9BACT|nr:MAG: hypothetical protein UT95_C0001G0009 [Candidatus Curtissbacteria bacterium GW2011_GWB1_40_28]KKR62295.1 MAG: hypothetical protein UU00_C0001G0015 [Microgenomates group bacterium GW2011_GWC1_40_35]KKR66297.1 MAG: hypothetical protein UU05_C0002G0008 [Candidatus Curtissbacteria bacterium GW2011_GWA1_40_47]KKS02463.1 MAG: hypothetical protein UU53_C0001G0008 [Candidatus Curtissbacteria bacterium GW2011_GWC2_41_21]OGD79225.1 MAG: hypothetical protein A2683_04020 [Candidatus Curtissbacteria 